MPADEQIAIRERLTSASVSAAYDLHCLWTGEYRLPGLASLNGGSQDSFCFRAGGRRMLKRSIRSLAAAAV
jgi:hypothetical protein